MMNMDELNELTEYIENGTMPYAVVKNSMDRLKRCGYEELKIHEHWEIKSGGKYMVNCYGTSLFAFAVGNSPRACDIHLAAAHTDHPCLRVKPAAMMEDGVYRRLNTEVYGGAILNSWLDRPLSLGGRVVCRSKDDIKPEEKIVDFKAPMMTIPSLAIHMNREVNKGVEINKQNELIPLVGLGGKCGEESQDKMTDSLIDLLSKELEVDKADILDYDLYVYNAEKPELIGFNHEMLSAPRLDNLTSCWALVKAMEQENITDSEFIKVIALFDNEEIGSTSKQGADSGVLNIVLERIYTSLGYSREELYEHIFSSMALSVDVAHAYHPAYRSKSDPTSIVSMGEGFAIKLNYSQKYATDSIAVGTLMQLCDREDISYQKYVNRSDIAGGSTIGAIISSHLPMLTVDMGIPILAMHSARETMAAEDGIALYRAVKAFLKL